MDLTNLVQNVEQIRSRCNILEFSDVVDKLKDACNDYAVEQHCQSTFIIDKEQDFLAEVFSKELSFFVVANKRSNKTIIVMYYIEH